MATKKLLVICGPTATGKTSLSIYLAEKFEGEIVSADSRQVYKGMDIGTGKDLPVNSKFQASNTKQIPNLKFQIGYYLFNQIPVWLLDVVKPNEEFSVSSYYHLAWKTIKKIWKKKKLPILTGGTGFYIRAVVDGVETSEIPRNLEIRAKIDDWSTEKLFDYLSKLDSEKAASMNWSDKNNPRRLVRAIEVAIFRKENPSWRPIKHQKPDVLFIGLSIPFKTLYQKIDRRVEKRLKQGIEKEIKELLAKGYTWKTSALGGTLSYKEWQPFFEGKVSKEEAIQRWKFDEHGYARRQMTWFKKNKRINWFDISRKGWQDKVEKLAQKWYYGNDAIKN